MRNSFSNDGLYELVSKIHRRRPVRIFIHTWGNLQSSMSWRTMKHDATPVSETLVRGYFRDMSKSIETLVVESEETVAIHGRKEGVIANSWAPVVGYKRMFYGMMRGAELVAEKADPKDMVIQTRFDVLSNWVISQQDRMLDFLDEEPEQWERIRFLLRPASSEKELRMRFDRWIKWGAEYEPHWTVGVDNTYMATVKDRVYFLRHMYFDLDGVNEKYRSFIHQEWITMFEAFSPEWMKP